VNVDGTVHACRVTDFTVTVLRTAQS